MGFWSNLFKKSASITNSRDLMSFVLGNSVSGSGIAVNSETALKCSVVFACVRIISDSVAVLPVHLYQGTSRTREKAENNPLYKLLHDRPNEFHTSDMFRKILTAQAATRGNGYAHIVRDGKDAIKELWPLPADAVTMKVSRDYEITYEVQQDGERRVLPKRDVLHYMLRTFDGFNGVSPIRYAREAIGASLAAEALSGSLLKNGAHVRGVIEVPTEWKMTPEQKARILKDWSDGFAGSVNAGKTPFLEGGMKYQQISLTPEDMQFIAQRKFQISEIARIFGVPLHMLGELDRATFSNIEQQSLEFIIYCLLPWIVAWDSTLNRDILGSKQGLFFRHNINGLLRGDSASRGEAYSKALAAGWMTVNEVREKEEMNPSPGGDIRRVPVNTVPATEATQGNPT
jgi:HK97 family phage portal protein